MGALLSLSAVSAGYGEAVVLKDISFELPSRTSLAVLGRNGVGKTTLVNTIMGLTRQRAGSIRFDGAEVSGLAPERRARSGLGWVPQERNVFRPLTVEENLTAVARPGPWSLERAYAVFPRLKERRRNLGNQLSGGEQQMLAVARALVLNPKLLLLDEPLEGLAPIIVEELLNVIGTIVREEQMSAIIVEQNARKILGMTDEAIILDRGQIVHRGRSADMLRDDALIDAHLGIGDAHGR
ncbi:ABC transporter ATP-binding protein [Propylenella binzhouense]|uniref:ABC transporter ATP-binding protein n=1 Tax=Propylenella binzhouense TaxID=2555902 RepID=A0A964WU77_9HYPH|nr:ABC transporter ATP-binding protein [Propylenella binzhouense]MYZ48817.1 ABC transporter ATP-binding protein [Propylenella binzhouense]